MTEVYANSSNNTVQVGSKSTSYKKTFDGKTYTFIGAYNTKSSAKQMATARKMVTGYNHRIVPFNGMFLLYTKK